MMDDNTSIELINISKSFKIQVEGDKTSMIHRQKKTITKQVLNHLNLTINKGELIGIVGRNGCGKSTLLKLISKIMEPDDGEIKINGKIASILELGMGFHQDLSGKDNIYLKGELYGFSKKQMDNLVNDIISYADIGEYIDNPVRTYSSGMRSRLAFSIMIHVNADIFVVDEVLSTGDAAFSKKASDTFRSKLKDGKTVILVSHSLPTIIQLCTRAIWIENGKIMYDGSAKKTCNKYQNAINNSPEIVKDLAESGLPAAQYNLALMYRDGRGCEKNETDYLKWLKQAADSGHGEAQLLYGDYLAKNNKTDDAAQYYQIAGNNGLEEANIKLAALLAEGNDDYTTLLSTYEQLIEKDYEKFSKEYVSLLLLRPWDSETKKKIIDIMNTIAEKGDPEILYQLGLIYLKGIYTEKNIELGLEKLKEAAKKGHIKSIQAMGDIYYKGDLTEFDYEKAFEYYLSGARLGIQKCQLMVANMYLSGIGIEKNEEQSKYWNHIYSQSFLSDFLLRIANLSNTYDLNINILDCVTKAANTFNYKAITELAKMYKNGDNTLPDIDKAKEYYSLAASWPGLSRIELALMYYRGELFGQDLKKAKELLLDNKYLLDDNLDSVLSIINNSEDSQ